MPSLSKSLIEHCSDAIAVNSAYVVATQGLIATKFYSRSNVHFLSLSLSFVCFHVVRLLLVTEVKNSQTVNQINKADEVNSKKTEIAPSINTQSIRLNSFD